MLSDLRLALAILAVCLALLVVVLLPHFHDLDSPDFQDCVACHGASRLSAPEERFELAVERTLVHGLPTLTALDPSGPETSRRSVRAPPRG